MTARTVWNPILFLVLTACGTAPFARAGEDFAFFHENVMGTALELKVRAASADSARRAEARTLAEIDRLSAVLSGYDAKSEFRLWSDHPGGPVAVSPELFAMLSASDHWRSASHGAFDPRVQVWSALWGRCEQKNRLPTESEMAQARKIAQKPAWRLDPKARTAERLDGPPASLNAIAKGFIVEKACKAAMKEEGIEGVVLNVGGDLRACGSLTAQVGIVPPWSDSETSEPIRVVTLQDRAMATSGRSQRGFAIQGQWYSHIFDPRTGRPVSDVASVSVIAPDSADADALATTFNVLPPRESLKLAESLKDVECLIVTRDHGTLSTNGWERFETPPNPALLAFEAGAKARSAPHWSDDYELVVDFTINRPDTSRSYRRPYVALWISDEAGKPVRYLILWVSLGGSGPDRWLPDLRRWYRSDKSAIKMKNMAYTQGRPTKPPGKYSVAWDGKGNSGKPVPPGTYTVNLEAVREEGTYGLIRKEVTIGTKPFAEELKGNDEIKSASVIYRRKSEKAAGDAR
jgi:thiamine biosynthesis lipoprotein ApbE